MHHPTQSHPSIAALNHHQALRAALCIQCVLVLLCSSSPIGAQSSGLGLPRIDAQERTLANGVRVIVLERPDYGNRVAARVFYKVDIAAERPGTAGLTHMLEHHLFKGSHFLGTTDWDAEREVAVRVERLAREVDDEKNRLKDCFRQRENSSELERPCTTPRLDSLTQAYDEAIFEHASYTI